MNTLTQRPLPNNIHDALDMEQETRTTVEAWNTLEPDTQAIMILSNPGLRSYVDYCKTVISLIDEWKDNDR